MTFKGTTVFSYIIMYQTGIATILFNLACNGKLSCELSNWGLWAHNSTLSTGHPTYYAESALQQLLAV